MLPRLHVGASMSPVGLPPVIGKRACPAARQHTERLLRHGIHRFTGFLPDAPGGSLDRLAVLPVLSPPRPDAAQEAIPPAAKASPAGSVSHRIRAQTRLGAWASVQRNRCQQNG